MLGHNRVLAPVRVLASEVFGFAFPYLIPSQTIPNPFLGLA